MVTKTMEVNTAEIKKIESVKFPDGALRIAEAFAVEAQVIGATKISHSVHATQVRDFSAKIAHVADVPPSQTTVGLALSGGGIRSATFGLGVLQALAARNKLASFDYLSTVSGGGYIGSWLSAWIHRSGLAKVQTELGKTGSLSKGSPTSAEPSEVAWLRRYSNYLAPRTALLSFDALTLIATWARNVALNAVTILGFLAALLAMPFLMVQLVRFGDSHYIVFGFAAAWFGVVFFGMAGYNLWQQGMPTTRNRNWVISTPGVIATVIVPAVLACCSTAIWLGTGEEKTSEVAIYACWFVGLSLAGMLVIWIPLDLRKSEGNRISPSEYVVLSVAGVVAFFVGVLELFLLYHGWHYMLKHTSLRQPQIMLLVLGPPMIALAFCGGTTVYIGMAGRAYFERSREWWSRLTAWLFTFGAAWAVWAVLAFFSLPLLVWTRAQLGDWIALLGTGWIGSLLTALLLKKPESTSKKVAFKVDSVLNIAATLFIAGLLLVLSALVAQSLLTISDIKPDMSNPDVSAVKPAYKVTGPGSDLAYSVTVPVIETPSFAFIVKAYLDAFAKIDGAGPIAGVLSVPAAAVLALLAMVALFSARVDVNKFSLHNMYKNRLVRCYLGASNQSARNEQPFTGLDEADDLPLAQLAQRPMQILNAALNITQGSNLAWQERKAASFIFSPVVCGYSLERTQGDSTSLEDVAQNEAGYRMTSLYGAKDNEEKGFTLGMAFATSGAALSPNMGYASRPARAFVLTLFNVRLGRWSANPARDAWESPSPTFGLIPLLQELFGYSNEKRNYVYLSDGGHFDNLGIYELVRRRCKTIVAVDAGADPERKMKDLAEAVRKCRVDLGIEIELPGLGLLEPDEKGKVSHGFTKGLIRYYPLDRSKDGVLLLIKPTLTSARDEPVDLLNYAEQNPPFPQQSTSDQFFDESQFESYRRLGAHITGHCLDAHGALLPEQTPPQKGIAQEPRNDVPALSTRFLATFFRKKNTAGQRPTPPNSGAIIDMHIGLALLTIVGLGLFAAYDQWVLDAQADFCFSRANCEAELRSLFTAAMASPRYYFAIRVLADCGYVLLYSMMFITGALVASSSPAHWKPLRLALTILFLVTASSDTIENMRQLGWLQSDFHKSIVPITQAKSWLIAASVASLMLLWILFIGRIAYERWACNVQTEKK